MYLKEQEKVINISLLIGFIATSYFLLSNQAHDATGLKRGLFSPGQHQSMKESSDIVLRCCQARVAGDPRRTKTSREHPRLRSPPLRLGSVHGAQGQRVRVREHARQP